MKSLIQIIDDELKATTTMVNDIGTDLFDEFENMVKYFNTTQNQHEKLAYFLGRQYILSELMNYILTTTEVKDENDYQDIM